LQVFTSRHEDFLLRPAGEYNWQGRRVIFAPCKLGQGCIAVIKGKENKIMVWDTKTNTELSDVNISTPLMQALTEREVVENITPTPSRMCILCFRYNLQATIAMMQGAWPRAYIQEDTLLQWYRNRCDQENGYKGQYMIRDSSGRFNGYLGNVVGFLDNTVFWMKDELMTRVDKTQSWRVCQDLLKWEPPQFINPLLGESQRDF
jgi:hypothetical protein